MVWKGSGDHSPNALGSGVVVFRGLGVPVRCGRMNGVYFTTRLYRGLRAELLVRTAHFQFIPGIPCKQTITLRLNPNLTLSLSLNLTLTLTLNP